MNFLRMHSELILSALAYNLSASMKYDYGVAIRFGLSIIQLNSISASGVVNMEDATLCLGYERC